MATRGQKLKLVIFLVGTGAVLLVLVVAFLGVTIWQDVERYYVLVPDSIEGLDQGAPVKIRGVRVGSVGALELDPEGVAGVRVTLRIDSGVRVSQDTQAFLKFQGLTGIKLVDLMGGSAEAPALPPGSYIPYRETPLEKLGDRADEISARSLALIERANVFVSRLVDLVDVLEPQQLERSFDKADVLLSKLIETNAELTELIRVGGREFRRTSANTARTLTEAQRLLASAREVTTQLSQSSRELHGLIRVSEDPLRTTVYNLRETSQSLKELGMALSQQPSSLLFSKPPSERELP